MIAKLIPVFIALAGLGGGAAAGFFLRPKADDSAPATEAHAEEGHMAGEAADDHEGTEGLPEFVKLSNQFVVPVVSKERVAALVVLSLSLEVAPGNTEAVFQREPKLRDVLLQVLFDHANLGGFSGSFTDGSNLVLLRGTLLEAAKSVLGPVVQDVLITDIARQDS
jgi:flagellar protein FliL